MLEGFVINKCQTVTLFKGSFDTSKDSMTQSVTHGKLSACTSEFHNKEKHKKSPLNLNIVENHSRDNYCHYIANIVYVISMETQ